MISPNGLKFNAQHFLEAHLPRDNLQQRPLPITTTWNVTLMVIFQESNSFGTGFCFRDSNGSFLKAQTITATGSASPKEAEARAFSNGISWIRLINIQNVIFDVDSKQVADSFNHFSKGNSDFNLIMSKCRYDFSFFLNSRVGFIQRQINRVTHNLAKASRFYASSHNFDYIPNEMI